MTESSEPIPTPRTLGELRASGWRPRTVKEEMRANLLARLGEGRQVFPGIVGYEDTVLPAVENAILAGQDLVFLGERGQAKTRMARLLVGLLDPWLPTVAGGELNDDPTAPVSASARAHRRRAKATRRRSTWLPRDRRYGEKLATPDITIADLIGEVDPIKVAEGRYLSRRADHPLRAHPARQPGHLRDQRAARPRRADPGRPAQHPRGARRPGPRLHPAPAARPVRRGQRQPRGLHQPRPDHHAAQGPPRVADPDALPAHARARDRDRPPGAQRFAGGRRRSRRSSTPAFMEELIAELTQLARRSPEISQRIGRQRPGQRRQPRGARGGRRSSGRSGSASRAARRGSATSAPSSPRPRARSSSRRVGDDMPEERIVERLITKALFTTFGAPDGRRRPGRDRRRVRRRAWSWRPATGSPSREYVRWMREVARPPSAVRGDGRRAGQGRPHGRGHGLGSRVHPRGTPSPAPAEQGPIPRSVVYRR